MLKNYLKIALRNLRRQKGYSFINIGGLAVGMTCILLILLWVQDELSFDRFHANAKTLYRVEQDQKVSQGKYHVTVAPFGMAAALKAEIPEIQDASRYSDWTGTLLIRYGEKAFYEDTIRAVDASFLRMFTYPVVRGNAATALDDPDALIITEAMAGKHFGTEDPIGKSVIINNTIPATVTAVLKTPPANSTFVPPKGNDDYLFVAIVRLKAGDIQGSLDSVRAAWEEVNPLYPFEYRFFDQDFDQMYRADERMGAVLRVFAALAVIIACLGLFGLASFMAEQRTKEIGIRKVLGASAPGVVVLLSREFAKWVAMANLIAWPVAYLVMRGWLQDFASRRGIAWWLFAATGAGTLVIALLTVGYQAVRAALANPVESLRYE
jgi:putative ABC transport system permease protein